MIASQQKLDSIGMPPCQLEPPSATKNAGIATKRSPYEQAQVLVEYLGHAPGHDTNSTPINISRRHVPRRKVCINDETSQHGRKLSSSATRHRLFLSKTLGDVHEQLEPAALKDISA